MTYPLLDAQLLRRATIRTAFSATTPMFHLAIFSEHRHEQWNVCSQLVGLRESPTTDQRWTPVWDDDPQLNECALIVRVEPDFVLLESVTTRQLRTTDGRKLTGSTILSMPCRMRIGDVWVELRSSNELRPLVPLNQTGLDDLMLPQTGDDKQLGPSAATVTRWLAETAKLHRAAAGSQEFYDDAARFAVETVGLDGAWVLRRDERNSDAPWQIVGSQLTEPEKGICFDENALNRLALHPTTWYQQAEDNSSLRCPNAIVIAPVLDEHRQLIGAIYGVRNINEANRRRGVRPLEARLVQLLADSVAVGIARLQRETEAARARVLLEQAFSPTVAEYIQQHPESLAGQEREVSLMFADLRGYSALAETLQLTDCYELLGDVMEALTQVVVRQRGVVVDYYGDGLLALWNAPIEQPAHADLACQAAIELFDVLDPVAEKWKDQLDRPLELGIGVHTGVAYVGNAGTRSRLKYGPRGNAVNVANRVQAASKQLQLPLVITAATQTKLSDKFFTLRVCTAKLPGLERPAELFTAYPASQAAAVKSRLDDYSRALQLFEDGELEAAEQLLSELADQGPATPAHFLAHYTAAQKNGNLGRRAVDKYAAQQGPVIEIISK